MKAPAFWFKPPNRAGLLTRALAPAGAMWGLATTLRAARAPRWTAPVPVICLGNVTAGGAGKTPAAIAVLERLAARGIAAHALSRGYGGAAGREAPHRVDLARDDAAEVGDEPLLLAAFAPVWVSPDRVASARAAAAAGAQALVLDDGFQNPALAKTLSLVVIDAASGFGNGRLIPAGPLREPLSAGLARAEAALLLGSPEACAKLRERTPALDSLPVLEGEVRPRDIGLDWSQERVLAFAGIARPEKFFDTLRGLGADLVATRAFADHQPYAPAALRRLEAEAEALGARLVTTEKDAVRLPTAFRGKAMPLPVTLHWRDAPAFDALLEAALDAAPAGATGARLP
ncbi:MAG: tetraacyldisaccharide 4'-kinase [Pseudomonadota bacterium]